MKQMTKRILIFILCLFTLATAFPVKANAQSYGYDIWMRPVPEPDAYEWKKSVRGSDAGISGFDGITDVFYRDHKIYVAMTGEIAILDEDFQLIQSITAYKTDKGEASIANPTCVYVTEKGSIYVCEEAKGQILEFDQQGTWKRTITNPEITGMESLKFQPTKVVVDRNDRIYVKAKSVYEGIIELTPQGDYSRFVGANQVEPSFIERFYRLIATKEQKARMALWLPTDYSDIALDEDGFLMATVKDNKTASPIRRLNAGGSDIMPEYDTIYPAMGDLTIGTSITSQLVNIATAADGRFAVLDSNRSRIFVYSKDALLLYTLGGIGKQTGSLNSPVDVCFMGDKILVADLVSKTIEVFEPTGYGALINTALDYQGQYDYEAAYPYWQQVYDINPHLIAANVGLGKWELRNGDFENAMKHFKACGERESYSTAYEQVREKALNQGFAYILLGIILLIVVIKVLKKQYQKKASQEGYVESSFVKKWKKIKYTAFTWPGYVISHPFKAFDDVKYEDAGSVKFGVLIFVLFTWSKLIMTKYSGFLVNRANTEKVNVPLVLVSTLVPYLLFIIGNWAIGTLIDGKGNMKNIFKVTAYSLYPSIYLYLIGTVLSRIIIQEEALFVQFLFAFPTVLFVLYAFIGLLMIHQFTFTKGIGSVLLSIVAMGILIFIIVLFVTLGSSFINDMMTIWNEFSLYYL